MATTENISVGFELRFNPISITGKFVYRAGIPTEPSGETRVHWGINGLHVEYVDLTAPVRMTFVVSEKHTGFVLGDLQGLARESVLLINESPEDKDQVVLFSGEVAGKTFECRIVRTTLIRIILSACTWEIISQVEVGQHPWNFVSEVVFLQQ